MAWDCRIGFRLNLFHVLILKVLLAQVIHLGFFSNNLFTEAVDLCEKVHHCICGRSEYDFYEIQCPNKNLAVYPISAKVYLHGDDDATLELVCDYEKSDFSWRLIRGLNFSSLEQDEARQYSVTKLIIKSCPIPPKNDGMADLLNHLGIDAGKIKYFKYESYRDLPIFPDYMLSPLVNLTDLNLSQNRITSLPNLSFFPVLKHLEFHTNGIMKLSLDSFVSNKLLQRLQLRNNNLTEIADGSLPESLEIIDLQSNRISTVTNTTFSNLSKLRTLYLNGNPLENLDIHAFSSLPQLRTLKLDTSSFKSFPNLNNLPSLADISMSYNLYYQSLVKIPVPDPTESPLEDETTAMTTLETIFDEIRGGMNSSYRTDGRDLLINVRAPTSQTTYVTFETTQYNGTEYPGTISDLPSLKNLTLSSDGLTAIPILKNLPNLTNLVLRSNKIRTVEASTFLSLPSLRKLDLSRNEISNVADIQAKNLVELDLSINKIDRLGRSTFEYLINLEKLSLARNQIEHIDAKAFEALQKLKELDLSHNRINLANPQGSTDAVLSFGFSPLRFCLALEKINLSHNQLNSLPNDFYSTLLKLTSINLKYNKFTVLRATDVTFLQSSIEVDLSYNKISVVDMSFYDVFLDAEARNHVGVRLDDNPLNCDCNLLQFKLYDMKSVEFRIDDLRCIGPMSPKNLTGTKFQSVPKDDLLCPVLVAQGCPDNCDCWRRPSDFTLLINCGGRYQVSSVKLPRLNNSMDYPNAKKYGMLLNLSDNGIKNIPDDYAAALPSRLRGVDLRGNSLQSLSFLKVLGDNNTTRFNLSDNPFPCYDCGFHTDSRSQFLRIWDSDNLTCRLEDSSGFQTLKALEFNYESICSNRTVDIIVPIVVCVLLIIIVAIVYIRNGWAIRAYMYSKGYGFLLCDTGPEDDEEKLYDAFVSYSHRDEAWVLEELVNRLEEQEGFKLCLHFRDWTPGDWIPDQIVRSVDQSRRTVVVLSKNFVESVWSRLEFKAAHSQALSERSNRLILVLMGEDLTDKDVKDDDLRVYMKMNTYIKWNDPWFWHKLKYALPHRKCVVEENSNNYIKRVQRERAIQLDKIRTKMESQVSA